MTQIHDHGVTPDGEPFIVMELLEGETLGRRIKQFGALPAEDVVLLIGQTAKGLAAAHRLGVVHRDIKPENLFITDNGGDPFVKVLDFGIAKQMDVPRTSQMITTGTTTGMMMGTPPYMSPEQYIDPQSVGVRADLWALGIVTYEALTGMRPFYGPTMIALAMAITEGAFKPPSLLVPHLPQSIDAWMAKALAKKPENRFVSAVEMVNELAKAFNFPAPGGLYPSTPPSPPSSPGDTVTHQFIPPFHISDRPPASTIAYVDPVATTAADELTTPVSQRAARRSDGNALPFPRERLPVLIWRTFDAAMAARIERGVLPRTSDDKWFVFMEDKRLYFHYTKTGNPVYEVFFEPAPNGGKRIVKAWVATNRKAMQPTQMLSRLFDELFDPMAPPSSIRFDNAAPEQRIWIHEGDQTSLYIDAIVSSADSSLLGGGEFDGDIHRASGAGLLAECRSLGGCPVGEARKTKGHSLPVKYVIHTVGPEWNGGIADEKAKLSACYGNCLSLAAQTGLRTIAFPSISTRTKRFPLDEAAFIAAKTTLEFLRQKTSVQLVIFCTFSREHTEAAYRGLARALAE